MLSNKAIPKYYGIFRDLVVRGEIPVCEQISMEMNRIDDLIDDPGVYYDPEPVEAYIRFCENELTLTDGSDFHLLLSFKVWAEQLYCWFYYVEKSVYDPHKNGGLGGYVTKRIKKRLIHKQYIIVGRGAGKSLYAESIAGHNLSCSTESINIIATSPTLRQTDEILSPLRTALARSRGPLFKFLTEGSLQNTTGSKANRVKMSSTKKGIENFLTNSILEPRPMTIDKLQSFRCKGVIIDEWLSGDTREDVVSAAEQSASKIDDYWMVLISSEGTVRNGVGDTIKMELMSILKGDYVSPHTSIWWYKLDDIKEVNDPEMWLKANPNIGETVDYEVYQDDVTRAEQVPSARNDILAKRFGLPMEGYTYFFTYEETLCQKRKRDFWGMQCSLGIDLSQGDDFCAFTFLFPLQNGSFGIKVRSYITERTLMRLPVAAREKYEEFINEGSLIIMDDSNLNLDLIFDDLDNHIMERDYDINCLGYDPYNAKDFIERWEKENGPFGIEKVIQGAKTETVPLGEIKHLSEDGKLLFDEALMTFCMGNAIVLRDNNGNCKLSKNRYESKIDNVSALMDAYVAYKGHSDMFDF